MTTWISVARYHLADRYNFVAIGWCALAFAFGIDVVILVAVRAQPGSPHPVGGLATICAFLFAGGLLSVSQSLPFGLALGLSRRSYYLGTVLLAAVLAAVDGLAITGLQAIERATGGWGIGMHFFQVPYILSGPWYFTWLTSSVGLGLVFIYGIWFGLVFRRWNLIGLAAFAAAQVTVLAAGALVVTWTNAWASVGHFFTALSAAGLTGGLAAVAVVLAAGGFATMRRVTV
jgi:hypothetical protein